MKKKFRFLLYICVGLSACTNEVVMLEEEGVSNIPVLQYAVETPRILQGRERTSASDNDYVATDDETKIASMALLFFNKNEQETGTYVGCVEVKKHADNDAENSYFRQPIDFSTGSGISEGHDYDVLVLANWKGNMADDITKLTEKLTGETTTLRQAKTLLTYDYTNFSRGGNFLMSAQGEYSAKTKTVKVWLRRTVAKIVIKAGNNANFTLKSFSLANNRQRTYAIDLNGNIPAAISPDTVGYVRSLAADGSESVNNPVNGLVSYAFENYTNDAGNNSTNTLCAIVALELNSSTDKKTYYYRLNLNVNNESDGYTSQRIYRNTYYEYTIEKVNSAGSGSVEDALNGSSNGLLVSSNPLWDDDKTGAFVFTSDAKKVASNVYSIEKAFEDLYVKKSQGSGTISDMDKDEFTGVVVNLKWYNVDGTIMTDNEINAMNNCVQVVKKEESPIEREFSSSVVYIQNTTPGKITVNIVGYGTCKLEIQYRVSESDQWETLFTIPVKISRLPVAAIRLGSYMVVAPYNVGATDSYGSGTRYFYNHEVGINPCPSGWHLPTEGDLQTLLDPKYKGGQLKLSQKFCYLVDENVTEQALFPWTGVQNALGIQSQTGEGAVMAFWINNQKFEDYSTNSATLRKIVKVVRKDIPTLNNLSLEEATSGVKYAVRCVKYIGGDIRLDSEIGHNRLGFDFYEIKVPIDQIMTSKSCEKDGFKLAGDIQIKKIISEGLFFFGDKNVGYLSYSPSSNAIPTNYFYWDESSTGGGNKNFSWKYSSNVSGMAATRISDAVCYRSVTGTNL